MKLSNETQTWKLLSCVLFILVLLWGAWLWYLYWATYITKWKINSVEADIGKQVAQSNKLYESTGFNEFLAIKEVEASRNHLPWSTYVKEILSILDTVKGVESEREEEWRVNLVTLSDFKVNLEELSLNWVVSNLKLLYQSWATAPSLITSFNSLDFLDDIQIRKYERNTDQRGFSFTLSAKVNKNAWEEQQ